MYRRGIVRFAASGLILGIVLGIVLGAGAAQAQPVTSPSDTASPAAPTAPAAPATPAAPTSPAPARPGKAAKPMPPPPAVLPAVGQPLALTGSPSWPKLDWLYDVPAGSDAAGKVVIHWFCAPKLATCPDDLARIVTLKESGRVYVVAYINGAKPVAQKLDPIRDSEGVGKGTVAFGRGVTRLMKDLGITGPASIVVGVDGMVELVTTSAAPADLDARDARVNAAAAGIREYVAISDGPGVVKTGEKFQLSLAIKLAPWLKYSASTPTEMTFSVPRDIKCDQTTLRGEQIKVADRLLTAAVSCSGPHGIYEARGELRFGYDAPGGGTGLGAETVQWKFEIKD